MTRLDAAAREAIHAAGRTVADYVRERYATGTWAGEACGCPDDRCIGYHHERGAPCGCLAALLDGGAA